MLQVRAQWWGKRAVAAKGADGMGPNVAYATATAALPTVQDDAHPRHRVEVPLPPHIDVSQVTDYLRHHLDCTGWHVVCHHDHQWIVHLTRGNCPKYAVCYECTPAVEKGIYHGNRAWAMTIIPLHSEADLPATKVAEIQAGLAGLR